MTLRLVFESILMWYPSGSEKDIDLKPYRPFSKRTHIIKFSFFKKVLLFFNLLSSSLSSSLGPHATPATHLKLTIQRTISQPGCESEETTATHSKLRSYCILIVIVCSAALTGSNSSNNPPPTRPPSSPPVHPHRSLMMCRLHRAGLSNDNVTISKNLLLPYVQAVACFTEQDTACHKHASPPYIFLSKRQSITVYYTSRSAGCGVLFQLVWRHQCCSTLSWEGALPLVSISNKSLVFAAVKLRDRYRAESRGLLNHTQAFKHALAINKSPTLGRTCFSFICCSKKKVESTQSGKGSISPPA